MDNLGKMSRRKTIFHILIFAGIAASGGCLENRDAEEKSPVPDTLVVVRRKNIDSTFRYNDKLTIRVLAPVETDSGRITDSVFIPRFGRFIRRRDTLHTLHYPQGVTFIFSPDSSGKESRLIAGAALLNEEKNSLEFTEKIVIITPGDSIFVESLTWNRFRDEFSTDLPVTIKNRESIITGDGLRLDLDFSDYTIMKVSSYFFIPNE